MQIFDDLSKVKWDKNTVVTIGTFDGVHLGHKKIIDKVIEKASAFKGRSFLITFHPHPRKIITGGDGIKLLSTTAEKAKIMAEYGIDNLLIINFTKEFSQLTSDEFLKRYIIDGIGVSEIIIGYDHHFGKGRGGNETTLREIGKESGFDVTSVGEVKIEDITISSSKIRKNLDAGNIGKVTSALGRYYSFSGEVVEGDKRGRTLGFPTANIKPDDPDKMLPALGIYLVEFFVKNEKHHGLLSVGKRPTFYNSGSITPEVYIYNFNRDIYFENVTVNVIEKLRDEEKFSSVEELIYQMNIDKQNGLEMIRSLA
ncbi:MAG: bifunctional riboflavin kinase/FAD synthetase [Ignavibacteriaceae bacterium]